MKLSRRRFLGSTVIVPVTPLIGTAIASATPPSAINEMARKTPNRVFFTLHGIPKEFESDFDNIEIEIYESDF